MPLFPRKQLNSYGTASKKCTNGIITYRKDLNAAIRIRLNVCDMIRYRSQSSVKGKRQWSGTSDSLDLHLAPLEAFNRCSNFGPFML